MLFYIRGKGSSLDKSASNVTSLIAVPGGKTFEDIPYGYRLITNSLNQ
jgi:hypothetical protein